MKNHTKMYWFITLIDAKPLRIRFNKIDGSIRVYDGTRHLVFFGSGNYDCIYSRTRYLINVKSGFPYKTYAKTKVDSCNFLPLEKTITFHYTYYSAFIKEINYYNIVLEKASSELPKK